jgi:tetraacyldisaccharide 4'-kinase
VNVHPIPRALLWPFSLLFGAIVRVRALCYRTGMCRQARLKGVVISVGNLTVGGTGKTPIVQWIVQRLFDSGKRVGILSRGYRGTVRSDSIPLQKAGDASQQRLSDEVWLLGQRLGEKARIGVGADRYAHGLALEGMGIECFVLDDGFQHLQLARDVDVVLIDATNPFGGGRLLPAGRLREPLSALSRADVIVITRSEHAPAIEATVQRYSAAPIFYAQTQLDEVRIAENTAVPGGPAQWLGRKVFAFCAIGNAAAFFEDVRHWGMELVGRREFLDHHRFTLGDATKIESDACAAGAEALVCTQKDIYNLQDVSFRSLPLYSCQISMRISEPDRLWEAILAIATRKRQESER